MSLCNPTHDKGSYMQRCTFQRYIEELRVGLFGFL